VFAKRTAVHRGLMAGIVSLRAPAGMLRAGGLGALLRRGRPLSTAAGADGGPLHSMYSRRVAEGQLEDDAVQRKVVQFLAAALERASASAAKGAGGGRASWAWPVQTLGSSAGAVREDHQRVAAYTARLAAENAQRVRSQALAARGGTREAGGPAGAKGTAVAGAPAQPLPAAAGSGAAEASRLQQSAQEAKTAQAGATTAAGRPAAAAGPGVAAAEAQPRQRPVRQSVYMHGPVGTGKTMLLDLFFARAREAGLRVLRKHFYEFMLGLHQQIHEIQEERPVEVAANSLADEVDVLCFDEFQVTDIQDAAILPRLFEVLFLRGVVVVMTSNTSPQLLYSGGLNRHVHLPAFISLLADHCTVLGLGGPGGRRAVDYRRRAEAAELGEAGGADAAATYLCGADAEERLRAWWSELRGNQPAAARKLSLPMGRSLALPEAAGDACFVGFAELCGTDRGEADFLALAENFSTVLLGGVPRFATLEATDEVRRFVKLLDVLYDRRVRLALAAEAPLEELFAGLRAEVSESDAVDLAWRTALYSADGKVGMAPSAVGTLCEAVRATDRAESRLREMRTGRYWRECRAARAAAPETE